MLTPSTPLLDRTRALLAARGDLTLEQVAEAAGVNAWWLRSFAAGKASDYGVRRVQALHDYLASRATPADEAASA